MLTGGFNRTEISILPTGLGNHYTAKNHLIPPSRKQFPYSRQNSVASHGSVNPETDDPNAPEANMSFRSQNEYFGPDVLVILGVVLASGGAILTLVSFYCQFKHPAIQATIGGIGPSLIGIGMLFCVLRLFFCSYFTSRTCCECLADGITYLTTRCPFLKKRQQRLSTKKRVHPLLTKSNSSNPKLVVNGSMKQQAMEHTTNDKQQSDSEDKKDNGNTVKVKMKEPTSDSSQTVVQNVEMTSVPSNTAQYSTFSSHNQKKPIFRRDNEDNRLQKDTDLTEEDNLRHDSTEDLIGENDDLEDNSSYSRNGIDDDVFKAEIAILDDRLASANSNKVRNQSINELVLKQVKTQT